MEWRTILAVVLSILVLVLWQYGQYVFSPPPEPPRPPSESGTAEQPPAQTGTQPRGTTQPSPPSLPRAADIPLAKPAPALQTLNERLQSAVFTPSVTQLSVTAREPSGAVQFEYEDPTGWRVVKRFELRYGSYAIDLGVTVVKPGVERAPPATTPAAPREEQAIILENDLLRITMTSRGARMQELLLKKYAASWPSAPNLVWQWDFLWGSGGPGTSRTMPGMNGELVNLIAGAEATLPPTVEVSADGRQALLRWGPGLYTDLEANGSYAGPITFINGERWLDIPKASQPPIERTGAVQWTAVQNKYYAVAIIPRSGTAWSVLHQGAAPEEYAVGLRWPLSEPRTETRFTLYTGPKELEQLAAFGVMEANGKSLAELVYYNYGWVRVLRPDVWLLQPLQWLYHGTHNYGVAIIIITVIVKLIFYPLTVKSFRSMQAMQRVQPQMKRLQDMYKQDRQKLNEEMMKLYREQKVNPMGGCLPMVVQIPVFIALYQVLYASIELRQADFFWWIKDLSAPDHPMALIMGASMVIQQWMTPTTGDPRQAKMMLFMPIIFTFMFLNFPVGLVIYWLVNNILSIAQQYTMLRMNR